MQAMNRTYSNNMTKAQASFCALRNTASNTAALQAVIFCALSITITVLGIIVRIIA